MWRTYLERHGRAFPLLPHTLADLPPQLTREECFDRCGRGGRSCSGPGRERPAMRWSSCWRHALVVPHPRAADATQR
jgi:hypothetical protein